MRDNNSESTPLQTSGVQQQGIGRRRLLRAGLAATPVVLAVSGRSALAQATCPAGLSGPTFTSICPGGVFTGSSHHTLANGPLGLSPGYWKPNPNGQTFKRPYRWPIAPFAKIKSTENEVYVWGVGDYLECNEIASSAGGWSTGKAYNSIFASTDARSFSRILLDDNGSLKWHLCAAYLNARAIPAGQYAMTPADVLSLAATRCLVPGGTVLTDGQIKAFLSQTWA